MTYDEFEDVVDEAWDAFFDVLDKYEINRWNVYLYLNRKDCFKGVFDAVLSCVKLESEDD